MTHPLDREIVRDLRRLARGEPTAAAASRAMRRVRAQLASPPSARCFAWLRRISVPAGIAASLGLVAAILLLTSSDHHVNAAAQLDEVARINGAYQGWIQITSTQDQKTVTVQHINTIDGTFAQIWYAGDGEAWMYEYDVPATGKQWAYTRSSNEVRVGSIPPDELTGLVKKMTEGTRIESLIAAVNEHIGPEDFDVHKTLEDGTERYEFEWGPRNARVAARTTILVDPDTKLVRKSTTRRGGSTHVHVYGYGRTAPQDIYDLGVPQDAKVVDLGKSGSAPMRAETGSRQPPVETVRPATLTREELLETVQAARDTIVDLQVTFIVIARKAVPHNLANRFRATVVLKGSKTYIDRLFSKDLKSSRYESHRVVAYNGERFTYYQVNTADALVSRERSKESETQGLGFFDLNLLNPPRPRAAGHDDQSLMSLLRNRKATVRERIELVNGRACHVVDTSALTVWLDAERGALPLRQVYHGQATGGTPIVFIVEKVAEVTPGLWLVTRGRKIVRPTPGVPEVVGGLEHIIMAEGWFVGPPEIRVNAGVDDAFFDLWTNLPPGVRVWDKDTNRTWTTHVQAAEIE